MLLFFWIYSLSEIETIHKLSNVMTPNVSRKFPLFLQLMSIPLIYNEKLTLEMIFK